MAKTHTDREYEAQLDALRDRLRRMARRVDEMLANGATALMRGDEELAKATIDSDAAVDRLELEVDELCLHIMARFQPVASDLRFVTAALKMVTDLERIGDLAVNVCERVADLRGALRWGREDIERMADKVRAMVRDATDSFVELDADKALAVVARDDEVDALYTVVFRNILDAMKRDPEAVRDGIHVLSVAKWLERIADHATNLAEQAVFTSKGTDIRHPDKLPR